MKLVSAVKSSVHSRWLS